MNASEIVSTVAALIAVVVSGWSLARKRKIEISREQSEADDVADTRTASRWRKLAENREKIHQQDIERLEAKIAKLEGEVESLRKLEAECAKKFAVLESRYNMLISGRDHDNQPLDPEE